MGAEESIGDMPPFEDELTGDEADQWLQEQAITTRQNEPVHAKDVEGGNAVRTDPAFAHASGTTFSRFQQNILKLLTVRSHSTNRELATMLGTTEGSVKDARRKIRRKLANL